jgi:hypothetical protein
MKPESQLPPALQFPRLRLVAPPLVPLTLLLVLLGGFLAGHEWSAHGSGLLLLVLAQVTLLVAFVIELVTLGPALATLQTMPSTRTRLNLASAAFAATFVCAAGVYLVAIVLAAFM